MKKHLALALLAPMFVVSCNNKDNAADNHSSSAIGPKTTNPSNNAYARYGEVILELQRLEVERRALEGKLQQSTPKKPLTPNVPCVQSVGGSKILCGGGSEVSHDREGPNPRDHQAEQEARERAERERAANDRAAKVEADRQVTEHFVREMEKSDTPEARAAIEAARRAHDACAGGGRCIGD